MYKTTVYAITTIAIFSSSAFAFTTTVSSVGGVNSNNYANGEILSPQGVAMADWNLTTSVSNSDFDNDAVAGGNNGLQYVMYNEVEGSTQSNLVRFFVTPNDSRDNVSITIQQSPYTNNESWNGGDAETSQFYLNWNDFYGQATINDPSGQLSSVTDGQQVTSPAYIRFSTDRAFNDLDAWSIDLPTGSMNAEVNWSSSNPASGSTLTREWITFDATVVAAAVPEPAGLGMIAVAFMAIVGFMRRRG